MRFRKVCTLSGKTGSGKSSLLEEAIENYQYGHVIIYDRRRQKNHLKYPLITPKMLASGNLVKGVYRLTTMDWKEVIDTVNKHPFEGMFVLEDVDAYVGRQEYLPLLDIMVSKRHVGTDIVFTSHKVNETANFILRETDNFFLFKTGENLEKQIKSSVQQPELVLAAHKRVEGHEFPHYYEHINLYSPQKVTES